MIEFVTVTPGQPIVTVPEAKLHLRVDMNADDTLIGALIDAAQQYVEDVLCWRALTPRTVRATFDGWHAPDLWLPMPPVVSVASVSVVDNEVPPVVVDPGVYRLDAELGRVQFWGTGLEAAGAPGRIAVEYECGYATPPAWGRAAVLLMVGHLYENRETVVVGAGVTGMEVPLGVVALAAAYRAWRPGGAV